ncbi:MAG TPA: NAC family transcription factor [Methanoregulaceae archaeon]|nr:NAC family transcription factor [Methanoregulaceae archaeon]
MGKEEEGIYCTICGGMVSQAPGVRQVTIDGKPTGITGLDECIAVVRTLGLKSDAEIAEALLDRLSKGNYIPTRKRDAYAAAILAEYRASND